MTMAMTENSALVWRFIHESMKVVVNLTQTFQTTAFLIEDNYHRKTFLIINKITQKYDRTVYLCCLINFQANYIFVYKLRSELFTRLHFFH